MRQGSLAAVALIAMALIGLAVPAQGRIAGHTISPAGLMDTRINFVPPVAAVFVVDNAKGQISICYPDNKYARRRPRCLDAGCES